MLYTDEEVWCECSDDELYNPDKGPKGTWQPKPADILSVFEQLKDKKVSILHTSTCYDVVQTVNMLFIRVKQTYFF